MLHAKPILLALLLTGVSFAAAAQTPLPVQMQNLPVLQPVGGGLATPAEVGLSDELWHGLSGSIWQSLIATQPSRQASPDLRQLLAHAIAARTQIPTVPPAVDTALLRAKALSGYVNDAQLGLFISAQPAPRTAALEALRAAGAAAPQNETEAQLQADLAREKGDSLSLRTQKMLAAASHDPAAAEWLATYGYGDAAQLRAAYESTSFAKPPTPAAGARYRAWLWQHLVQSGGDEQLKQLNQFLTHGGAPALLDARGSLLLSVMPDEVVVTPQLFALAAAQENRDAADSWYDATQPRLWPLAIAMGLDAADPGDLTGWFAQAQALPAAQQLPLADILTLLEARGLVIPPALWQQAAEAPGSVATGKSDPVQLALLQAAAAGGRQGESILRAGILADTDLAQAPVPTTAAIIRAMAALGLNEIADRLTVEALLALLFPPHE